MTMISIIIGDDREGGSAVFLREAACEPRGPAGDDPEGQAGRQENERHQHTLP